MKKRLSLLMVLMMVVSLLPMSAFAAVKAPVPNTIKVKTSDITATTTVNTTFEFATADTGVAGQTFRIQLTEGAKLTTVGATLTGDVTSSPITLVTNDLGGGLWLVTIPDTAKSGPSLKAELSLALTANIEDANEGKVSQLAFSNNTLVANANGNLMLGDPANVNVFQIEGAADTKALAVDVRNSDKTMSFDGGELSVFEIKNIPVGTTKVELVADKGLVWDDSNMTVPALLGDSATVTIAKKASYDNILVATFSPATTNVANLIVTPMFEGVGSKVSEGNVSIYADSYIGATLDKTSRTFIIGKLVDFGVTMTVVEKGKKEIPSVWGGEETDVTVTLEGPKGSFARRAITIEVDGATIKASPSPAATPSGVSLTAGSLNSDENEFDITGTDDTVTKVKFDMTIVGDFDLDGTATITASQKQSFDVSADLAKVTPKFTVKTEVTPVKKGEARNTSDIVITEAKAGLLTSRDSLVLTFDTKRDYVEFTSKKITVEATNGMTFEDVDWAYGVVDRYYDSASAAADKWVSKPGQVKYAVEIPVKKSSIGEPAVITVSGLNVAVDGSTTDDVVKINAKLNTKGVKELGSTVVKTDYIKVVKEYDLESILSVFTIGQTTYTVNGVEKAAASAPYIKEGRTMLPIRAVAESLGLTVQWNAATKTASFTDASKVAAVTIGANVMYVNGTPMPLSAPAELVNDTTFVELRSLATAFGVQIDWDAAAKTATVSK